MLYKEAKILTRKLLLEFGLRHWSVEKLSKTKDIPPLKSVKNRPLILNGTKAVAIINDQKLKECQERFFKSFAKNTIEWWFTRQAPIKRRSSNE